MLQLVETRLLMCSKRAEVSIRSKHRMESTMFQSLDVQLPDQSWARNGLDETVASCGCEIEYHQFRAAISKILSSQKPEAARVWNSLLSM